jgi:hypothetical protein
MPGGRYSSEDRKREKEYCSINFYAPDTALCPKIWSTSPGTIIYDNSQSSFAGRVSNFEQTQCRQQKKLERLGVHRLAKLKTTMNAPGTSGTFSTASLLYYHFSRYFKAVVHVPVSVWRSVDRKMHYRRVTEHGVLWSSHNKMLHAGWEVLAAAEKNPATYTPVDELFTKDRTALHGILLNSPGRRYSTTVNGTRASGWGRGQNFDFQKTAPYLALRSELPLPEAVDHGLHTARRNNKMNRDLGHNVSREQIIYWMTELTEITLLDYIFNQQDRIGNIDFIPYWYWQENGQLFREKATSTKVPAELAVKHPLLLKRTRLNDNDAGARLSYANFTRQTKMLEKQRHYRPETYRQLIRLNKDFTARGELYSYLKNSFGLSEKQLAAIVKNTAGAARILQTTCRQGKLRFDLDPDTFIRTGKISKQQLDCDTP